MEKSVPKLVSTGILCLVSFQGMINVDLFHAQRIVVISINRSQVFEKKQQSLMHLPIQTDRTSGTFWLNGK